LDVRDGGGVVDLETSGRKKKLKRVAAAKKKEKGLGLRWDGRLAVL
jgi:hypothetical protein